MTDTTEEVKQEQSPEVQPQQPTPNQPDGPDEGEAARSLARRLLGVFKRPPASEQGAPTEVAEEKESPVAKELSKAKRSLTERLNQLPDASPQVREVIADRIERLDTAHNRYNESGDQILIKEDLKDLKSLPGEFAGMLSGDPQKVDIWKIHYPDLTAKDLEDLFFIYSGEKHTSSAPTEEAEKKIENAIAMELSEAKRRLTERLSQLPDASPQVRMAIEDKIYALDLKFKKYEKTGGVIFIYDEIDSIDKISDDFLRILKGDHKSMRLWMDYPYSNLTAKDLEDLVFIYSGEKPDFEATFDNLDDVRKDAERKIVATIEEISQKLKKVPNLEDTLHFSHDKVLIRVENIKKQLVYHLKKMRSGMEPHKNAAYEYITIELPFRINEFKMGIDDLATKERGATTSVNGYKYTIEELQQICDVLQHDEEFIDSEALNKGGRKKKIVKEVAGRSASKRYDEAREKAGDLSDVNSLKKIDALIQQLESKDPDPKKRKLTEQLKTLREQAQSQRDTDSFVEHLGDFRNRAVFDVITFSKKDLTALKVEDEASPELVAEKLWGITKPPRLTQAGEMVPQMKEEFVAEFVKRSKGVNYKGTEKEITEVRELAQKLFQKVIEKQITRLQKENRRVRAKTEKDFIKITSNEAWLQDMAKAGLLDVDFGVTESFDHRLTVPKDKRDEAKARVQEEAAESLRERTIPEVGEDTDPQERSRIKKESLEKVKTMILGKVKNLEADHSKMGEVYIDSDGVRKRRKDRETPITNKPLGELLPKLFEGKNNLSGPEFDENKNLLKDLFADVNFINTLLFETDGRGLNENGRKVLNNMIELVRKNFPEDADAILLRSFDSALLSRTEVNDEDTLSKLDDSEKQAHLATEHLKNLNSLKDLLKKYSIKYLDLPSVKEGKIRLEDVVPEKILGSKYIHSGAVQSTVMSYFEAGEQHFGSREIFLQSLSNFFIPSLEGHKNQDSEDEDDKDDKRHTKIIRNALELFKRTKVEPEEIVGLLQHLKTRIRESDGQGDNNQLEELRVQFYRTYPDFVQDSVSAGAELAKHGVDVSKITPEQAAAIAAMLNGTSST